MTKVKEGIVKKLQEENEKIREEIDKIIGIDYQNYSPLWEQINLLIDNEIEQESYCNE